jgi:hypothetical protein
VPLAIHPALSMIIHGYSKVGKSLLGASTPWPRVLFDVEAAARFLPIKAISWDPANPRRPRRPRSTRTASPSGTPP